MSTDKLHSTPNNDGGACSVHTTALITTDELLSKSMKQFTRRGSKSQLASEEVGVPQQRLDTNGTALKQQQQQKQLGSKTAVVASADPYSFDIEDNSASQKPSRAATEPSKPSAAAQQAKSKKPCNPISVTAASPSSGTAEEEQDQPQPSPPKQARHAGAEHVGNNNPASSRQQAPQQGKAANTIAAGGQGQQQTGQQQQQAQQAAIPARPRSGGQPRSARAGSGGDGSKKKPACAASGSSNPANNLNKPAGSGGAKRPPAAAAGNKRGRGGGATTAPPPGSQPQQQRSSSSPPDSVGGVTISPPTTSNGQSNPSAPGPGAVSLPTPHRRSKLAARLAAAAAAAGGTEARPAQTVMEAQERGELVQMQDDAAYAMDGLGPTCSIDTQRDSAVTLAEMLGTRKGRVALRADGLAQQFLTNLAKLKAGKDAVLALAATLSLWHLAAEDANPCYLASVAAAVLVDQLLQHDYTFDEVAAKSAAGAKLCRVIRTRPLVNVLASAGINSTRGLLLVTLEQATSSVHASKAAAVEKLKHNLRQHGALQRLASLVADTAAAPGGPVAAAQQLNLLLLVLENATFTCPENGTALAELQLGKASGSKGAAKGQSQQQPAGQSGEQQQQQFPAAMVGVAQQLLQGVDQQEQSRAALHSLLSVMMNLIHDNKQGGALLCRLGGMDVAAGVLSKLLLPSAGAHEALSAAVLQHLELLSVALGVLMNLVSNEPQHSKQLAAAGGGGGAEGSGDSSGGGGGVSSFVRLLCTVMTALGQLLQRMEQDDTAADQVAAADDSPLSAAAAGAAAAAAAGGGGGVGTSGLPSGTKVVTSPTAAAEALGSNTASEASIVELYSGILLGFLVRDGGPELARAVSALLPGGSLDPLTSATGRCLEFYVRTGAITDHTRTTLEGLLKQLTALKAGLGQQSQQPGVGGGVQQPPPEAMLIE